MSLILLMLMAGSVAAAPRAVSPNQIGPVLYYDPHTKTQRPFYPVGWYTFGVVGPPTIVEIAATGANTVLFAGVWDKDAWHFPVAKEALDKADEIGVKIVMGFHQEMILPIRADDLTSCAHLQRWVQEFANHPAMLGWQLGDENGGPLTAPMIQTAARAIRQWDSNHQIWQVFSVDHTEPMTIDYMKGTDVYSLDFYQYLDGRGVFAGVDALADVYLTRALWAQKHGWSGAVNVTQAVGPDAAHLSEFRFPNELEYRWNVFNAMAGARARGTLNWIYSYGEHYYSDLLHFTHFRDDIVAPVTRELRALSHALETGWNVGKVASDHDQRVPERSYGRISHLLLHDDATGAYYLIVTNNTKTPVTARMTLKELPVELIGATARIEKKSKDVPLKPLNGGYELLAELEPFGVNVYTLPGKKPATQPR